MRKIILAVTLLLPLGIIFFLHYFGNNHYALKNDYRTILSKSDSILYTSFITAKKVDENNDARVALLNVVSNALEQHDTRITDYISKTPNIQLFKVWLATHGDSIYFENNGRVLVNTLPQRQLLDVNEISKKYYLIDLEKSMTRYYIKYDDKQLDTLLLESTILSNEYRNK